MKWLIINIYLFFFHINQPSSFYFQVFWIILWRRGTQLKCKPSQLWVRKKKWKMVEKWISWSDISSFILLFISLSSSSLSYFVCFWIFLRHVVIPLKNKLKNEWIREWMNGWFVIWNIIIHLLFLIQSGFKSIQPLFFKQTSHSHSEQKWENEMVDDLFN